MNAYIVGDKGRYNDWEKINLVKGMLHHYNEVKIGEVEFRGHMINRVEFQFDDLSRNKINKLEKEYIARKQDEKQIIARRKEINELLKNELLTKNKRAELINEYNEIGLKWFSNDDDELYEAIIIASNMKALSESTEIIAMGLSTLDMLIHNYLIEHALCDIVKSYKIRVRDLTDIIMMIKYILKEPKYFLNKNIERINMGSLLIAINALILEAYDAHYQELVIPYVEFVKTLTDNQNIIDSFEFFEVPQGTFINLYNLFVTGLTHIDVDEFIQVFPLKKDFESGKWGCKDYFFSIESLEKMKSNEEYFKEGKMTETGARFFFCEMSFEEKILEFIQVQMFEVVGYGTNINTLDLMMQFLEEAKEEADNPRSKFKVIK